MFERMQVWLDAELYFIILLDARFFTALRYDCKVFYLKSGFLVKYMIRFIVIAKI